MKKVPDLRALVVRQGMLLSVAVALVLGLQRVCPGEPAGPPKAEDLIAANASLPTPDLSALPNLSVPDLAAIPTLSVGLHDAQTQTGDAPFWQQVFDGFYGGRKLNIFQPSVANGVATAGDVDGDGDLDIIVGGHYGGVRYYRNDGTPTAPNWTLATMDLLGTTAHHLCSPKLGDLDGDGDLDLTVTDHGGWVYFYRNDGKGNFTNATSGVSLPSGMGDNGSVAVADLDNDGDLDILLSASSSVYLFWNTGTKTSPSFGSGSLLLPAPPGVTYQRHIALCDIDGDGDYDLFCTHSYRAEDIANCCVVFYENTGGPASPSYTLRDPDYFFEFSDAQSLIPCFLDYDGDGDYDAVLFSAYMTGNGFYGLLENSGNAHAPRFQLVSTGFHMFAHRDLQGNGAFGDLDNDGDLDMVQSGRFTGIDFGLFRNMGSPLVANWVLENEHFVDVGTSSLGFWDYRLFDIDADGDLDLFAMEAGSDGQRARIHYWPNEGTATSAAFPTHIRGWQGISGSDALAKGYYNLNYMSLCFGDLNGDSLPDLVIGATWCVKVFWYPNTGTRSNPMFTSNSVTELVDAGAGWSAGSRATCPSLVDVDGDGDLDLFVAVDGDGAPGGQIRFFRNTGNSAAHNFVLEETQVAGFASPTFPFVNIQTADIDGDGNVSLFINTHDGGIIQYRAILPMLSVRPRSATVLSGAVVDFVTSGQLGAVSAAIVENRSTGSLTGLRYAAGLNAGVLDRIKFTDSGSTKVAYAYVNVIDAAQLALSGKAVVMAGTYGVGSDSLWQTTNNLANFLYRTLLYRGFSKENICYLNPVMGQDVDNNGNANDDVDGTSSLSALQYALTSAAGSPELFVYLIDHGGEQGAGSAFVRCNSSEVLTASQLDGWLDALQALTGVTTLTVVVDCCQSGSFLDELRPTPGAKRIVVASTQPSDPAFFSAGGLISFTESFVNSLYMGFSVGQAFRNGAGAMDRYQKPWLDDNGDGVYDKDADGALADRHFIGARYIAGADRPQIGKISANQTLTSGVTQALIWASDVSSVYPIERVWATIVAPDFVPSAGLDPSSPVVGLPEIAFAWNAAQSRWEATTNTFTQMGAYRVNIYARDIWQSVAYPKQTYINQMQGNEKVIIVAGDGDYDANSPWAFTNYLTNYAYRTALARWINKTNVTYLNGNATQDVDGNGAADDVDATPTKAALVSVIGGATTATQLTVYLVGHGAPDVFTINSLETLTAAELDAQLDALQSGRNLKVVVVLDFWNSGSFLNDLIPPPGEKRVVVASCSASEWSLNEYWGMLSFSQFFLNYVFNGWNVNESFRWARVAVRALTAFAQNPLLDDDADGDSDKWDGAVARVTWIGAAFVTGADLPLIGDWPTTITLLDRQSTATLWTANVTDPDGIAQVWAIVTPPHFDPAHDTATTVALAYSAATARYEATVGPLAERGTYQVTYYARDRQGDISLPRLGALVALSCAPDLYDRFYNDDTTATLNFISPSGGAQIHNLHDTGDSDWGFFHACGGYLYTIQVRDQATSCDAAIHFYKDGLSTGPLIIDESPAGGTDEVISWSCPTTGTYYLCIRSADERLFGNGTTYTLAVTGDWGANCGLATISTGAFKVAEGGTFLADPLSVYLHARLTVPPGALSTGAPEIALLVITPEDLEQGPPYNEPTRQWLLHPDQHTSNCTIVHFRTGSPVTFLQPIALALEMINDSSTAIKGFRLDDLDPDDGMSNAKVYRWTGSQWQVYDPAPTINGMTVTTSLSDLSNPLTNYFAVSAQDPPLGTTAPPPPTPVLNPEPPFTSGTTNRLTWNSVPGTDAYCVEYDDDPLFVSPLSSGWITGTEWTAMGLADGVTYYYRLQCRNRSMTKSGWSDRVSSRQDASGPTAPGTASDIGAYTSSTSVRFNWTAAADSVSGVASYDLQVGTAPGGNNIFDGNVGNVLTKTATGSHGQTLYARVRARDAVGNIGNWSASSDGILIDTVAPTPPGTPTDAGAYIGSTSVEFNWTAATDNGSGVASYDLRVGTTPGGNDIFDGNVGNVLTKTVTGSSSQTLYAQVCAHDAVGNIGNWSASSDGILIDTVAPTPPGIPTDIGVYTSSTSVRFDWTAATDNGSGVASYDLQVGTARDGNDIFDGSVGNVLTRTVTGSNGQTLYARVRARDAVGNIGDWSGSSNGITVNTGPTGVRPWQLYR